MLAPAQQLRASVQLVSTVIRVKLKRLLAVVRAMMFRSEENES